MEPGLSPWLRLAPSPGLPISGSLQWSQGFHPGCDPCVSETGAGTRTFNGARAFTLVATQTGAVNAINERLQWSQGFHPGCDPESNAVRRVRESLQWSQGFHPGCDCGKTIFPQDFHEILQEKRPVKSRD